MFYEALLGIGSFILAQVRVWAIGLLLRLVIWAIRRGLRDGSSKPNAGKSRGRS
jgi:hypothetical protein